MSLLQCLLCEILVLSKYILFFYFKLCKRAVNNCWPNLIWSIKQTLKLKRNSPQQFLEGIKGEQVIVIVNIREVFQKKVAIFFTFAIKRQTPPKMPKIGPIINKIEIWPKSDPKVINSGNKSHRGYIWVMLKL